MARDLDTFFTGCIDEVRIYNIHIPDSEIDYHWQKTGMMDEKYCRRYLQLHYTMDLNINGW